jgi:uncharacterized protein (DUF433 family)
MTQTVADLQTVVNKLTFLEGQLHQLRDLVSAQLAPSTAGETPTSHRYITRAEGILSGEPIIAGTRTPVRAVVEHWKFGDSPETIVRKLPHLRLAQVFDALSYYDDHRDEIEQAIARNRVPVDD